MTKLSPRDRLTFSLAGAASMLAVSAVVFAAAPSAYVQDEATPAGAKTAAVRRATGAVEAASQTLNQAQGSGRQGTQPPRDATKDASDTRRDFMDVLGKQAPSLGRVLKLDPSLLSNDAYLAPYPDVLAFLAQHPEIKRSPSYFLESISAVEYRYQVTRTDIFRGMMGDLGALIVMLTVASVFVWFIRTLVDYRRWNRLSKVQAEAHTKLVDRFTANEDLLAYVQSSAGRGFLESAPISLDPGSRAVGSPVNRILWSVQAGVVMAAGGFGLCYVAHGVVVDAEIGDPLYTLGVFGVSIGLGFVISAAVAYFLTKRLGLLTGIDGPAGPASSVGLGRREAPDA